MKTKLLLFIAAILLASHPAKAQVKALTTPHNVVLTWVASADTPLAQVYRFNGACPTPFPTTVAGGLALGFQLISGTAPLSAVTYTDLGFPAPPLPPGNYCYFVVSVLQGAQSVIAPTGIVNAVILPSPPSGLVSAAN
jgi:hypothetical protein